MNLASKQGQNGSVLEEKNKNTHREPRSASSLKVYYSGIFLLISSTDIIHFYTGLCNSEVKCIYTMAFNH